MCFSAVSASNYEEKMIHEFCLQRKFLSNESIKKKVLENKNIQDIHSILFQKEEVLFFPVFPPFKSSLSVVPGSKQGVIYTALYTEQHIPAACLLLRHSECGTDSCLPTNRLEKLETEITSLHQTIAAYRLKMRVYF